MKIKIANKKRFIIVTSLLIILTAAIALGFKFFYELQNPEELFTPEKEEEETYDVNDQFDKNKINILIFGLDKNEYRDTVAQYGVYRSDTIMLATLDFEENTVDIVSLPRDTYVPIYNTSGKDKINSCFSYAKSAVNGSEDSIPTGIEYLSETVSNVLGDIPINYYVGITDMDVVTQIIDELGGIEVDVEHTLYADKGKDRSKVEVEEGLQTLNGKDLLYYARYRAYPLGDIDRVASQQHILKALMSSVKSTNSLVKLPQIYKLVSENLTTNLTVKQISALSLFGAKVEKEALNTYTLPGDFGELGGLSYWIINQTKRTELIKELYGIDAPSMEQDAKSDKLTKLSASVTDNTLQVGETTKLTINGTTANGESHRYVINDTKYSVSKSGVIKINEDNTILANAPGNVTLSLTAEGISTSVQITVQGQTVEQPKEPEEPVIKDTTPPVLSGVGNVSIPFGQAFDRKFGVGVKDETDPNPIWWENEAPVNVNKAGQYKIVYTGKDASGNLTHVTRTITVKAKETTSPTPPQEDSITDSTQSTDQ